MPADPLAPFDDADLAMMEADLAFVLAEPYDVTVNLSAQGLPEPTSARLRKARVFHEKGPELVARLLAQLRAAHDVANFAEGYLRAERARTRNEDPAAEERLDGDLDEAWETLRNALGIGDDCEACGAGDGEACAEGCPCREARERGERDGQCESCAGGTENYEEGRVDG